MSDRSTTRALDCGKTIDELSDYLAMDRIPFDPTIETCPECLNALHALDQIAQLSRDLLDNDAAHLPPPPAGWLDAIMTSIHNDVRAGRSLPLHHPDPRVQLSVSEGAVRALLRSVVDQIPGPVIGKSQISGDAERLGAPVTINVTLSIAWGTPMTPTAHDVRQRIYNALTEHTHLNVTAVDVTIEDIHGYNTSRREQP